MNNWGSTWEFTNYTNQNWWDLNVEDQGNAGGTSFSSTQEEPHQKGVNPLLRVKPPQQSLPVESASSTLTKSELSPGAVTSELIYATEAFDRQQAVTREVDSRWPRNQRDLQVPVLDDRLAVAFQKLLRDEEREFMLLIIASEVGEFHGYV